MNQHDIARQKSISISTHTQQQLQQRKKKQSNKNNNDNWERKSDCLINKVIDCLYWTTIQ